MSESYISELIKISKLDDEIIKEALTSTSWSRPKLLLLAGIKNQDLRLKKFEELKAKINSGKRSSRASTKEDAVETAQSEEELSASTNSRNSKNSCSIKSKLTLSKLNLKT
ncbi:MAG: hypothetical protein LBD41_06375 [Clostridiales Family XIII bacterium]|nr:hypothetical protein [Clostridiales Family XIII bacterium]